MSGTRKKTGKGLPIWENPVASAALTPLSWLYSLGWIGYQAVYNLKLKQAYKCYLPVICVGNLTVGGTGKTPTTAYVAQVLLDMGRKPAISCSGYGSRARKGAAKAPDGPLDSLRWGDEAALLRALIPAVDLFVGRDRVLASQLVEKCEDYDVLLMDDGFQHLRLHIDHSIILHDSKSLRRTLPAGPYREPMNRGIKRADMVVRVKNGIENGNASAGSKVVERRTVWRAPDLSRTDPPTPGEVNVLCAIGDPETFLRELSEEGFIPSDVEVLKDHSSFGPGLIGRLAATGRPTVVTAKDWVKISRMSGVNADQFLIRDYEAAITPDEEFRQWLAGRLDVTE